MHSPSAISPAIHHFTKPTRVRIHALTLAFSLALSIPAWAQNAATDWTPQVLLRFADGQADTLPAFAAQPPIYNPVDGLLYGASSIGFEKSSNQATLGSFYRLSPSDPSNIQTVGISQQMAFAGYYYGGEGFLVDTNGVLNTLFAGLSIGNSGISGGIVRWTAPSGSPTKVTLLGDLPSTLYTAGTTVLDGEGNLYFGANYPDSANSGLSFSHLYRLKPDGAVEDLVDFTQSGYWELSGNRRNFTRGYKTVALAYSADDGGAIYGLADNHGGFGQSSSPADDPTGVLYRVRKSDFKTDGSSTVEVLHTFTKGEVERLRYSADGDTFRYGLVEDGDFIYGNSQISVWRVRKSTQDFAILHTFGSEDGSVGKGPLVRAADGNIYGVTAQASAAADGTLRDGALFRIIVDSNAQDRAGDTYEVLSYFDIASTGASPVGLSLGPIDADAQTQTLYGAAAKGGKEGNRRNALAGDYARAGYGTLFSVAVPVAAGSVALQASTSSAAVGESVTLTWTVTNASACVASGGQDGDGWAGSELAGTGGTVAVTPASAGDTTYTLVCTDRLNVERTSSTALAIEAASSGGGGGGGALTPGLLLASLALSTCGLARRLHLKSKALQQS